MNLISRLSAHLLGLSVCAVAGYSPVNASEPEIDAEKAELRARVKVPRSTPRSPVPQPNHPLSHRKVGGMIGLILYVDEAGRPRQVIVGKSTGYKELDQAAIDSLGGWQLLPGTVDDVATPMWSCFMIMFHPDNRAQRYQPTQQDKEEMELFHQKCKDHRIKLSELPPRASAQP